MSAVTGSLEQALDEMLELRPFPAAASQLMAACNDKSCTIRELTEIIKYDPGLSMRLLKIANSPLYGCSGQIRSITQPSYWG
jgi:HD-like signal output (HDOD) protein